jgi:hypothetical protein
LRFFFHRHSAAIQQAKREQAKKSLQFPLNDEIAINFTVAIEA